MVHWYLLLAYLVVVSLHCRLGCIMSRMTGKALGGSGSWGEQRRQSTVNGAWELAGGQSRRQNAGPACVGNWEVIRETGGREGRR